MTDITRIHPNHQPITQSTPKGENNECDFEKRILEEGISTGLFQIYSLANSLATPNALADLNWEEMEQIMGIFRDIATVNRKRAHELFGEF